MNHFRVCNVRLGIISAAVAAFAFLSACFPSQAADLGTDYDLPGVRHVRTAWYFSNWRDRCAYAGYVSMAGTATSIIILSTIARPPMRSRGGIIVDISSRG